MNKDIRDSMQKLRKKFPQARSLAEAYLMFRKDSYRNLSKDYPVMWQYMLGKRYLLPNYRQADYANQEACEYLRMDQFFGYLEGNMDLKDHVSAHCINAYIKAMHYNRPTFFLERELGEPLIRTKLPLDFYTSDINWRWPAFRVYLPKNLLTITKDGETSGAMFLDICYVGKHDLFDLPKPIALELYTNYGQPIGKIPMLQSDFEGMSISTILDFDSSESAIAYVASAKLEQQTMRDIIKDSHEKLDSPVESDETDVEFQKKALVLAINILLFLSSVPIEYETNETPIRKAKLEGKRMLTGLFPAKFIGQQQLRKASKPSHIASVPTGQTLAPHWRAGHWKRQPFGPKNQDRKLIWISIYHTGDIKDDANK